MADINLKSLVKGSADIDCIKAGGIAVYKITADDNTVFQLEIDLSDKHDVGETATFLPHYDKEMILYLIRNQLTLSQHQVIYQ